MYENLENEGLGLGHSRVRTSPLGVVRCKLGMRLPRKSRDKTRILHACV